MVHLYKYLAVLLVATMVIGCSPSSSKTTKKKTTQTAQKDNKKQTVTKLSLNRDDITLRLGQTFLLEVSGNTSKSIVWGSYNNNISVVGDEGLIIPKSIGTTRITATVDGKTLECKVNIIGRKAKMPDDAKLPYDPDKTYLMIFYYVHNKDGSKTGHIVHTEEISSNLLSGLSAQAAGDKWVKENKELLVSYYGEGDYNYTTRSGDEINY
ncbi:MAG: hypothetical protein PUE27_09820 [Sharpea porci]|uniref:Ig-like domain-containing protein n=1 Tax=Sharpea porci TaxID=2652286 RepID=UPI0024091609|nr:hypothetical protein [Sharpea porci]MDD6712362.1 hypothetical protein [Sharpea porci]